MMLIPNPDLDFWNSDPKIQFWANLGQKSQSCLFCLKVCIHGISRMLILISTFVFLISNWKSIFWPNLGQKSQICSFFWISTLNFLFGQIWAKKVKVARFNWKLGHMASWKCRFRIRTYIFEIPTRKSIFGQIWPKKWKLFVLPQDWYTCYLEVVNSCCNISFLNFET